ncbi:uncharacterized protein LOC110861938 [Folsomia candida]|uniref:BZIP domain-containing protein n=1 Tax=Folsomia candida TaxID=158441 RepID=A0A226D1P5_FOLCA|nr:uncharacterized protein LOC110861938 [Folsomia candida]OXA38206.1 hypothetical protein Fcan01_26990 [Folsomia candida]
MQEQEESSEFCDNFDDLFKHMERQEAVQHDLDGSLSEPVWFVVRPVALDGQGQDPPDGVHFELLRAPGVDSEQLPDVNPSPLLEHLGGQDIILSAAADSEQVQDVILSPPLDQAVSSPRDESPPPPKRKPGRPRKQIPPEEPLPKKPKKYNDPNLQDKKVRNAVTAKKNRDQAKQRLAELLAERESLQRENATLRAEKLKLLADKVVSDGIIEHLRKENAKRLINSGLDAESKMDGGHHDLDNIEVTPLNDSFDIDDTVFLPDIRDPELDQEITSA